MFNNHPRPFFFSLPSPCFSNETTIDPPSIRCKNFTDNFGYQGAVFPCFYSKKNKTVVMTSYNRDTQVNTIIHFFIVPFIITVISSIGICIIHCNCSCKKERPKYRRPRIENIRQVFDLIDFRYFLNFVVASQFILSVNILLKTWTFSSLIFRSAQDWPPSIFLEKKSFWLHV